MLIGTEKNSNICARLASGVTLIALDNNKIGKIKVSNIAVIKAVKLGFMFL